MMLPPPPSGSSSRSAAPARLARLFHRGCSDHRIAAAHDQPSQQRAPDGGADDAAGKCARGVSRWRRGRAREPLVPGNPARFWAGVLCALAVPPRTVKHTTTTTTTTTEARHIACPCMCNPQKRGSEGWWCVLQLFRAQRSAYNPCPKWARIYRGGVGW